MNNQNNQKDDQFAPAPEIDPRFAAAHYGHDLTQINDIKAQLRTKTPNAWALMAAAEKASDYIALLESEAEQLRMSWKNSESRIDAIDHHRIEIIPEFEGGFEARAYQRDGESYCEPQFKAIGKSVRDAIGALLLIIDAARGK